MSLKRKAPRDNVRRVQSFGGNLCGVITNKMGRIVQFESYAERSLLLRLDRDFRVKDYSSQPETMIYAGQDGKRHRYTPDFIVWHQDGRTELHEVTRSERRLSVSAQAREEAAAILCLQRGWEYVVHTEATLPSQTEAANWLALYPYRSLAYAQDDLRAYLSQLTTAIPLNTLIDQLVLQTGHALDVILTGVYHYLWHDVLTAHWQEALCMQGTTPSGMLVYRGRDAK